MKKARTLSAGKGALTHPDCEMKVWRRDGRIASSVQPEKHVGLPFSLSEAVSLLVTVTERFLQDRQEQRDFLGRTDVLLPCTAACGQQAAYLLYARVRDCGR